MWLTTNVFYHGILHEQNKYKKFNVDAQLVSGALWSSYKCLALPQPRCRRKVLWHISTYVQIVREKFIFCCPGKFRNAVLCNWIPWKHGCPVNVVERVSSRIITFRVHLKLLNCHTSIGERNKRLQNNMYKVTPHKITAMMSSRYCPNPRYKFLETVWGNGIIESYVFGTK